MHKNSENAVCTLAEVCIHNTYTIKSFSSVEAELTLLRFGLGLGDALHVVTILPCGGAVVLECKGQEFALGLSIAEHIEVLMQKNSFKNE